MKAGEVLLNTFPLNLVLPVELGLLKDHAPFPLLSRDVRRCHPGVSIHDHIMVVIHDKALSEKLQMDVMLTLEMAKKLVHQREAVKEYRHELQGGSRVTVEVIGQTSRKPLYYWH